MDFEREPECILKDSVIYLISYKLFFFEFHLPFNLVCSVKLNCVYQKQVQTTYSYGCKQDTLDNYGIRLQIINAYHDCSYSRAKDGSP